MLIECVVRAGINSERKMWGDQPHALPCRYLHHAADCVDELIGAMGVFGHAETARIVICERRNHDTSRRIETGDEALSQCRYIMAYHQPCDNHRSGPLWLMNLVHRWLCGSARWKSAVETYILPWTLEGLSLGSNVLEVGPGPGATTDVLRDRVEQLTCVEVNRALADALRHRQMDRNVPVVCEDATAMSFPDQTFDGAVCFTMLHHVPSAAMQDRLLSEVARVLRPGGFFAGTDSLYTRSFRLLHLFDTMVVVDPSTFAARLRTAGFDDIS
jgi:SAM-dependent methyltransferase